MLYCIVHMEPLTPDIWLDPDAYDPMTRPGHWVSVLWIERLFWRRCVLLVNAFCQKSPVYAAHVQMTTIARDSLKKSSNTIAVIAARTILSPLVHSAVNGRIFILYRFNSIILCSSIQTIRRKQRIRQIKFVNTDAFAIFSTGTILIFTAEEETSRKCVPEVKRYCTRHIFLWLFPEPTIHVCFVVSSV